MDNRSFESGASATPPTAPASPSAGYPTNGNPTLAIPATLPGDYWFYQIGEELRAAIVAGGLTPAAGTLNQLASAIFRAKSLAANGYQTLPSGLIIQWGVSASLSQGASQTITLPLTFPNAHLVPLATAHISAGGYNGASAGSHALSTSQIFVINTSSAALSFEIYWFAIGY